jgi:RNA polymerase sigma-70 factor (ECF subfamily)
MSDSSVVVPPSAPRPRPEQSDTSKADDMLIRSFCDGELRAFEVLVIKYQRRVAALINASVHNNAVTEEITQETFLRAYRSLPGFRFESGFATWLYTIARNLVTSYHRDGHGKADNRLSLDGMEELLGLAATERLQGTVDGPEELLAEQQLAAGIRRSIDGLSAPMKNALMLREEQGLSYAQIAESMELPLNTVRSNIFRARATIADAIRPLLDRTITQRFL